MTPGLRWSPGVFVVLVPKGVVRAVVSCGSRGPVICPPEAPKVLHLGTM